MNSFDWKHTYQSLHSSFPNHEKRPVIGITGNFGEKGCELAEGYYLSVLEAGGIPVVIPPFEQKDALIGILNHLDGLVLSGGGDINPLYLDEEPSPALHSINPRRDLPELLLTRMAYNRQIPILGICRGIQMLAAALDGSVHQDIAQAMPDTKLLKHSQDLPREYASHEVTLLPDTLLYSIMHTEQLAVNSFHHQAVNLPGPHLRVAAQSADGVVEAVESSEHKSIIGVQWHPECFILRGDRCMMPLFEWLIGEAKDFRDSLNIHHRILTLDSHCDTPMFFGQDIHFNHRDPKILVDLHKMTEGHLDASIMVAYLPQGERDKKALEAATQKADDILNGIEEMVAQNAQAVDIARTPDDLYRLKREGKKAIMMGIENGYAIGHELGLVEHFRERGVVYMTLCHNGDNDICDSARGTAEHGGLSPFGREVIHEMNRVGMMVDLSHAAESTFWQALEESETPIVCSHSSCRALCDHPRNLTDEQMRALAQRGGVMQVTFYEGFLRKDGHATIEDAIRHINHAVEVMGIEHVGIGTDFDGDGGVPGLANASEVSNLTRMLRKVGYSCDQLRLLWGENFLRVMRQVQSKAMLLTVCVLASLFSSCGKNQKQTPSEPELRPCPTFQAERAMQSIREQCDFGARVPGTEAWKACGDYLVEQFSALGLETEEQQGNVTIYNGEERPCRNITAHLNPQSAERYLLCAHWDSRPWADNDEDEQNHHTPVLAANDGASGVAVLLEIARLLTADTTFNAGIDFVLFDVEDSGTPQWDDQAYDREESTWCLGSKLWATQAAERGYKARMGIVFDMVGGRGSTFAKESISRHFADSWVEKLWKLAHQIGYGHYFPLRDGGSIVDDHLNVNQIAQVPCIDIVPYHIDGPSSFGPTWHTVNDTPENIDPQVLEAVGQTVVQLLYNEQ